MAFTQDSLYLASSGYSAAVAQKIYTYKSSDNIDDIREDGYFNDAVPELQVRDLIYASGADIVAFLYVASIDPVTTADLIVESEFELQPNSVDTDKIVNEAVTEDKLGDASVSHTKLEDASVSGDKIAPLGIPHGAYGLQTIDGGDMMNGACGTAQIEDNAVSTIKIQSNAIDHRTMGENACQAEQIASDAITNLKVQSGAIDARTLASGAVGPDQIEDNSITNIKIQSDAIDARTIAANACGSEQIASDAVSNVKIQAEAVNARTIASQTIGVDKFEPNMWYIMTIRGFLGNGTNPLLCPISGVRSTDRASASTFSGHRSIPVGAGTYTNGVAVYFNENYVATSYDTIDVTVYTRNLWNAEEEE